MKRDSQVAANAVPHPKRPRTSLLGRSWDSSKPSRPSGPNASLMEGTDDALDQQLNGLRDSSSDEMNILPKGDGRPWRMQDYLASRHQINQDGSKDTTLNLPHYDMKARAVGRIKGMKNQVPIYSS